MTGTPRRRFLALAGTASLAGCTDLRGLLRDTPEPVPLEGAALRAVADREAPSIPETVPVDVADDHLASSTATAREHLDPVPSPLDASAVPNGAIRQELVEGREEATEALAASAGAASPLEAMDELRHARQHARFVAAGWASVEAGLTYEDVLDDRSPVGDAVDRFRSRWRYVGADPVRASLVHLCIQERVRYVLHHVDDREPRIGPGHSSPLEVGRLAGGLEAARASLADATHVHDRFTASLDEERSLRERFRSAATTLAARVRTRLDTVPEGDHHEPSSYVDRDVDEAVAVTGLGDLARSLHFADGGADTLARGEFPWAIHGAHQTLVWRRAFRSLRRRIEDGEHATVEAADDVGAIRAAAVTAIDEAATAGSNPRLNHSVLARVARIVAEADRMIVDQADEDTIPLAYVEEPVGRYVMARELARATPPASRTVAAALRGN